MKKALLGLGTVGVVMISIYMMQSGKADTHRAKASQELSRDIAELKAEAATSKEARKMYEARADEAAAKIKALETEEAQAKEKEKKLNGDLDAALKEMEGKK